MGWDGNARGTVNSDYVNDLYSTGTEAAYNMYLQYRYTNDLTYLRDIAYPYMREALRFYQNRFQLQQQRVRLHGELERPRDLLGRAQRHHRPGRRAAAVPADHPGQHSSSGSTAGCGPAGRTW